MTKFHISDGSRLILTISLNPFWNALKSVWNTYEKWVFRMNQLKVRCQFARFFKDLFNLSLFNQVVGLTNQRETTILWDKVSGKPLYNAIGS